MNLLIVTPAPPHSHRGNRVTALRWARILRQLGHHVRVAERYDGRDTECLIALHATRSRDSVERFKADHSDRPVIVALTGTDIYDELQRSPKPCRSLELASRLVALQPLAIEAVPTPMRGKVRVIYQSAGSPAKPVPPEAGIFEVSVLSHLRPVKDPLRCAYATRQLPDSSQIIVTHVGAVLSDEIEAAALLEHSENPRYHWLGEQPRLQALRILARSRLLVISSLLEGGANVVTEALACLVPVLASHIPGSIGILGDGYPGYFPVGDTDALAALLARTENDPRFYASLKDWCRELRPLADPERECRSWADLLAELNDGHSSRPTPGSGPHRLRIVRATTASLASDFAADVRAGLTATPKYLPCCHFYDEQGSQLFEEICRLPEYYLTRAERQILERHADAIAALFPHGAALIELGSGSAVKTRLLIEAFLRRQDDLHYVPIDISTSALELSGRELVSDYDRLQVSAIVGNYQCQIDLPNIAPDRPKLILWLGSNIGNCHRDDAAGFLAQLRRRWMGGNDRILLGIDLRKDRAILEAAYDDPQGVTARFNLNLLDRVNRELRGGFNLDDFAHRAVYNEADGRIEMYLISRVRQTVPVDGLAMQVAFDADETVRTEHSYKYSPTEIEYLASSAGLRIEQEWFDDRRWFTLNLWAPE